MKVDNLSPVKIQDLSKNGKEKSIGDAKTKRLLFLFIIFFSIYLRLPGIYNGLPYILNLDESSTFLKVVSLFKDFFKFKSLEPSLFNYLSAVVLFINSWTFDTNSILNILEVKPGSLYISLRLLSVIFGVGSVVLVYLTGLMFGSLVGIIASGLIAVSLLHIKFSQLFLPYSALAFFSLLNTYSLIKVLMDKDKNSKMTLPFVFSFICSSINYFGLLNYVSVLMVMAIKKDFSALKKFWLVSLISYLFINPQVVLNLPMLLKNGVTDYINGYFSYHGSSYLLYGCSSLLQGAGPIAWLSIFLLFFCKEDYDKNSLKFLFSLPLIYLAVLGFFHVTSIGYGVILIPYICLACGLVFNYFYKRRIDDSSKFIFILLLLIAFWIPLKYTFKYKKIMSLSDTRVIATEWIEENASGNVKIVWDKNSVQPRWYDAYNKADLEKLVSDPYLVTDKRKFLINPELLKRDRWLKLLKKKVDYVIVDNVEYEKCLREPGHKIEKRYYKGILKLKPYLTFSPYFIENEKIAKQGLIEELYSPFLSLWQRERPGPIIKIYEM